MPEANGKKKINSTTDLFLGCCSPFNKCMKLIGETVHAVLLLIMVIIGLYYLNQCPVEQRIPAYLVGGGILGLMQMLADAMNDLQSNIAKKKKNGNEVHRRLISVNFLTFILSFFQCAWFGFTLSAVVSATFPNTTDPYSPRYCHWTAFYFAFAYFLLCIGWFVLGLTVFGITFCCAACFFQVFKAARGEEKQAADPGNNA